MNRSFMVAFGFCILGACQSAAVPSPVVNPDHTSSQPASDNEALGLELAKRFLIVDGHIDVPYRLEASRDEAGALTEDISKATAKGDFDYPRAVAGGLDAPFMSIYVPARYQQSGGAKAVADRLIDMIEAIVEAAPDKFALATSVRDIHTNFKTGKVSLPLGIENGAALEDNLANVKHFYDRGVRYITLTHSRDNLISDSSYDDRHSHKGLTPFGKEVIAEMNRLGVIVDISHVSDDAFYQALETTRVPAIASHSSCRAFTPGFERNVDDAMLKALAKNDGVLMINFGSTFISKTSRDYSDARRRAINDFKQSKETPPTDEEVKAFKADYKATNPFPFADVTVVADHIDHVVKTVGINYVGLGSDFDGVGDTLPEGLKDASMYPKLITELLNRDYTHEDIEKICSGNVLRVWRAVEAYAAQQASDTVQ
ncbi:MAG: dipeptidase [Myxococcota bacterium]|nr:dipeptidase [Myxococcota bacterium]